MPRLRARVAALILLAGLLVGVIAQPVVLARSGAGAPPAVLRLLPLPFARVPVTDPWLQGERLVGRGEYAAAAEVYGSLVGSGERDAPRALLLQARALVLDERRDEAIGALERLLQEYPRSDRAPSALFALARARRDAGNCAGALEALDRYQSAADPAVLGPYPFLERAGCLAALGDWSASFDAARGGLAVEAGGPRLTRVNLLEKAAEASLKLGNQQAGFDFYNQALELARTRGYRAEMLFTTATLARALGRTDLAVERFRTVVVDFAEQPRAAGALEALTGMGRAGMISPLQAGLIKLNQADYQAAQALFEQVPASSPEWAAARFNRATARLRLGAEDEAISELRALAEATPADPLVPAALLRAGRLLESSARYAEADAVYGRIAQLQPTSDRLPEAFIRSGITRFIRNDPAGAVVVFDAALAPARQASPALQAQAQLWRGKALAQQKGAGSAEARDAWTRAVAAQPTGYDGLRAADLLAGSLVPTNPGPRDAASLAPAASDDAERTAFLARSSMTPEALAAEMDADPALARADELLDVGLVNEASWELEAVQSRYADARDVPRLSALADRLAARNLPQLALAIARQARDIAGGLAALPKPLREQVYPAAWGDLAFEQAAARKIDPLLLLGLARQESGFNAGARSSADARGLTQVVPATGRDIAQRLGRADTFQPRDLYRPAVSLEFGAYYLSTQLQRYDGRIFPALAAYNAGGGNVDQWLPTSGGDPDVFVEQIPFAETSSYVKLVYENYRLYRELYQ